MKAAKRRTARKRMIIGFVIGGAVLFAVVMVVLAVSLDRALRSWPRSCPLPGTVLPAQARIVSAFAHKGRHAGAPALARWILPEEAKLLEEAQQYVTPSIGDWSVTFKWRGSEADLLQHVEAQLAELGFSRTPTCCDEETGAYLSADGTIAVSLDEPAELTLLERLLTPLSTGHRLFVTEYAQAPPEYQVGLEPLESPQPVADDPG